MFVVESFFIVIDYKLFVDLDTDKSFIVECPNSIASGMGIVQIDQISSQIWQ